MAEHIMLKGYHYTKPTDPIRTDSARLYIDTNKPGEASSVPNGGAIRIGSDIYTERYANNFYIDSTGTKVMKIHQNNYYWMNKPSNWENISDYTMFTFTPYDSSLNTIDVELTSPSYIGPAGKWIPPTTASLEPLQDSNDNILHLKGIHGFHVKTPQNPHVIARIRKGYVDDNMGTLTTNSDGYLTYAPGAGISIGI